MYIGELGYESLRASDSYSFKFADSWIKKYNAIILSEDLNNYPGIQYTLPNKDIFGCFADALPEKRWIAQLVQPDSSLGGARPKAGRRICRQ